MKGNRKVVIALTIVMLSKNNQTSMDETLSPESIKEEEDALDLKPVDEVKDTTVEATPQKEEGKCVSLVSFCKEKNPMDNLIFTKPDYVYCKS